MMADENNNETPVVEAEPSVAAETQSTGSGDAGDTVVDEGIGLVLQENVVVLDAGRPVRSEAEFEPGADRAAPAGVVNGVRNLNAGSRREAVKTIGNHGGAALHVEQHVVPGVANLAGEQTERIDTAVIAEGRKCEAGITASEVGPVALRFEAKHPVGGLPAVADLTADGAAGRIVATFSDNENAGRGREVPALAAGAPAAVGVLGADDRVGDRAVPVVLAEVLW